MFSGVAFSDHDASAADCPPDQSTVFFDEMIKPKVLVGRTDLLPYSETFIREQVSAYTRWSPVFVGLRRLAVGLSLDNYPTRILHPMKPSLAQRLRLRALAELGLPPPGSIRRCRAENASIVHVHFATDAVKLWPVIRRLNLPLIVTLHGYDINIRRDVWERGLLPLGDRNYPSRLLNLSRNTEVHFLAVSEAIRARAMDFGLPAERIQVQHIGIDVERFKPGPVPIQLRPKRILYVGRLVEKKGASLLLTAFGMVRDKISEAELVIIGEGPLRQSLERQARALSLPVTFLGSVNSEEVQKQLSAARIFCLPSITAENGDAEGLPISILEAQASGVPVVTSARGGATEGIIDGVTGIAFKERDIDALEKGISRILKDDELLRSMAQRARASAAERFDIRRCTAALENVYDDLARMSAKAKPDFYVWRAVQAEIREDDEK